MNFFGDYHTHTIFSRKKFFPYYHAKGSIEDNVSQAKKMGLKEIAISDHGFEHKWFGCYRENLKETKVEVLRLADKYDINVLLSVESNFLSLDGTIDVLKEDMKYLDIVLCGYHKTARAKTLKDKFAIFYANLFSNFFGTSKKLKERNTTMIINALKKNKIDVLTHLNNKMKCDVLKVAKEAAAQGTLVELNEKHCHFSLEEVRGMLDVGAHFIVSSDAHRPKQIGKFDKMSKLIKEYKIPKERIVNLDKLPEFLNLKRKTKTKT